MSRDGAPVDPGAVQRMADSIRFRGPDRAGEWHNATVALAHRLFITTPEAAAERQPLNDERGALSLVFDGRLDNRDELRGHLRRAGMHVREDTDAELVLRGYQLWADELPARLLGDFAFAIWDQEQQTIFCARDVIGVKPFYYYCDAHRLVFASELIPFVASQLIELRPDEAFIAELLRDTVYGHTRSLLRGVRRLPGAHALAVTATTERLFRYWSPENIQQIRYSHHSEYAEHARDVLEQAVSARLRANRPVACDLSGGLDSSSVTAIACHLRRAGRAATPLFACSVEFPGLECDESSYINDFVAHTAVDSIRVRWTDDDQPAPDWRDAVQQTAELPPDPTVWIAAFERIASAGARVSLLGTGGDEWFAGSELCLADMLTHFRWGELARQFEADDELRPALGRMLRHTMVGVVPEWLRAWTRPWRGIASVPAPWVNPRLLAKAESDSALRAFSSFGLPERAQRETASMGFDGHAARAREMLQLAQTRCGIEPRFPFHDRRIIEFSLAIPGEQLWNRAVPKFVLRNSMADLLPASIRTRRDKAEFSSSLLKRLRGWQGLFHNMRIAARGWIDEVATNGMLQRVLRGPQYPAFYREIGALWSAAAVEAWDRSMSLG